MSLTVRGSFVGVLPGGAQFQITLDSSIPANHTTLVSVTSDSLPNLTQVSTNNSFQLTQIGTPVTGGNSPALSDWRGIDPQEVTHVTLSDLPTSPNNLVIIVYSSPGPITFQDAATAFDSSDDVALSHTFDPNNIIIATLGLKSNDSVTPDPPFTGAGTRNGPGFSLTIFNNDVSNGDFHATISAVNDWSLRLAGFLDPLVELQFPVGNITLAGDNLVLLNTVVELVLPAGDIALNGDALQLETVEPLLELVGVPGNIQLALGIDFVLETVDTVTDLIGTSGDIQLAGDDITLETIEPPLELLLTAGNIALSGDALDLLTQDIQIELLAQAGDVALQGDTFDLLTQDLQIELLAQAGNIAINGDVFVIETSDEFVGLLPLAGNISLLNDKLLLEIADEFVELIPSSGIIKLEGNTLRLRTIGGPAVATQDTPFVRYGLGSWDTRFAYLATHFNNIPLTGTVQLPYTFRVLGIELIAKTADEDSGFSDKPQVEAYYINPNESDEEVIIGTFKNIEIGSNYAILVDAPIVMLEDPETNVSLEFRVISGGVTGVFNVMTRPFEDFWKYGGVGVPSPSVPEPVT